ncbi:MAG: phytanoyl-CoA dioxygenase family protein [Acidimicrobiales bacterium]
MGQRPPRDITDDEKHKFWSDGVVCLRQMFDVDRIDRMLGAVDAAIAHPGPMKLDLGQGLAGTFHGDSFVCRRFQPKSFTGDDRYGDSMEPMPDIEAERDRHRFVTYETEPGDCIVHHGLTIHSAPGNASTDIRRRALATRFCGDDCTYRPEGSFQPLIRDPGIPSGAPLECELFPRV